MNYWREPDPDEAPAERVAKRPPDKTEVLAHVPAEKPITKEALRSKANGAGKISFSCSLRSRLRVNFG